MKFKCPRCGKVLNRSAKRFKAEGVYEAICGRGNVVVEMKPIKKEVKK